MKRLSILLIILFQTLTCVRATESMDWSRSVVFPERTFGRSETSVALGQCPAGPFTRTYTGHEELWQFGLLNANARLYNPYIGRFISPDPLLNSEGGPLDFNPYVYARNNPYSYIDRNGEIWQIVVAAIFGGGFNVWANIDEIHNAGDFFKFFGVGAAAGAASAALAPAVIGTIGLGTVGLLPGVVNGAVNGMLSNLIQSGMNYAFLGVQSPFNWKDFLLQTAISGGIGGVTGTISALTSKQKVNWLTGKPIDSSLSTQIPSELSPTKVTGFDENKVLSPQEKGKLGVEAFKHEYVESGGEIIGTEIPYRINGVNGRMDLVGKRNGVLELFEIKNVKKLSFPWSFTKNQRYLLPLLEKGHAFEFYGPKATRLKLNVNTPISKYNYQLIHKNIIFYPNE